MARQRNRGGGILGPKVPALMLALMMGGTSLPRAAEPTGHLTNLSVRAVAALGDDALTAGFAIAGPGSKRVLVRAAGPALGNLGVTGALAEVRLELYQGTT